MDAQVPKPLRPRHRLLRFAPWIYLLGGVAMIPWTIYLGFTLPLHYETDHYRGTWVIFDAGMAISITFLGWFARKHNPKVIIAAAVAATMLFADAWFDVSSAHTSEDHLQALLLAFLLEIPGGLLCLRIAHRSLARLIRTGTLEPEHERTADHRDDTSEAA